MEVPPGCGKKAWGDGDTDKEAHTQSFNHVRLFATPWTIAHQAPLSMGFSRQQYWSGVPLGFYLEVLGKNPFPMHENEK